MSLRKDGTFIAVEVDDAAASDSAIAAKLTEACPVDIFAQRDDGRGGGGGLEIVQRNLDECVLCRLCLDAADGWGPAGGQGSDTAVKVVKLYDDGAVLA
jgi:NAD-dependent dihydropyrimidine dehydrogenase PreA subunit